MIRTTIPMMMVNEKRMNRTEMIMMMCFDYLNDDGNTKLKKKGNEDGEEDEEQDNGYKKKNKKRD